MCINSKQWRVFGDYLCLRRCYNHEYEVSLMTDMIGWMELFLLHVKQAINKAFPTIHFFYHFLQYF